MVAAALFLGAPGVRADLIDPTGDTFGAGLQLDIITYDAVSDGSSVLFTVGFTSPVAPPSAFAPNSVLGFIEIDTGPGGVQSLINTTAGVPGPPIPLAAFGVDFRINIFSEVLQPGLVDVESAAGVTTGTVPITFSATGFALTVPLSALGNDDGQFNFALLLGNFTNATDRAPNGALPAASTSTGPPGVIPEPSSIVLGAVGLASLLGYRLRRRRCA